MIDNHDRHESVTTNETLGILIEQLKSSNNKAQSLIQKGASEDILEAAIKLVDDINNVSTLQDI